MLAVPIADRQTLLQTLQQQVRQLEKSRTVESEQAFSTGCPAFNRLLPAAGWQRGTLAEWFATHSGSGAMTLAHRLPPCRTPASVEAEYVYPNPRRILG